MKTSHSLKTQFLLAFLVLASAMSIGVTWYRTHYVAQVTLAQDLDTADKNHRVVLRSIHERVNQQHKIASDYGAWDSIYDYVYEPTRQFEEENFSDMSLKNIDVSAVIIRGESGELMFANSTFDHKEGDFIRNFLQQASAQSEAHYDSGIIVYEERYYNFISVPISLGDMSLVSKASLTFVSLLGEDMAQDLSQLLEVSFHLEYVPGEEYRQFNYVRHYSSSRDSVKDTGNNLVIRYRIFDDTNQLLPMVFSYVQAKSNNLSGDFEYAFLPIFIGSFIVGGLVFTLVVTLVLMPIKQTSTEIKSLIAQEGVFMPLTITTDNELGEIKKYINILLERNFRQNNMNELLLASIGDYILTIDLDGKINYLNPAAQMWLANEDEVLFGKSLSFFIRSENPNQPSIEPLVYQVLKKQKQVDQYLNLIVKTKQGSSSSVSLRARPIWESANHASGAIFVISPISDSAFEEL